MQVNTFKKAFSILAVFCLLIFCCKNAVTAVLHLGNIQPAVSTQTKIQTINLQQLKNIANAPVDIVNFLLTDSFSKSGKKISAGTESSDNEKAGNTASSEKNKYSMNPNTSASYFNVSSGKHFEADGHNKALFYDFAVHRTRSQKNTNGAEVFLLLMVLMLMTVRKSHNVSLLNVKNIFYIS